MRDTLATAIETIVASLHRDYHDAFDCDATVDDATEDHDGELAAAGQIITDLRRAGLTIAKQRQIKPKPRYGWQEALREQGGG